MPTPEPGKVFVYNRETGEVREHWPIDAREIVSVEGTPWTLEPVATPWKRASAPAAGEPTTDEELEGLTKDELKTLAEERGVTVTRADGEDGEPLKADYIAALSGS
jgi:hypothetical protein